MSVTALKEDYTQGQNLIYVFYQNPLYNEKKFGHSTHALGHLVLLEDM